MKVGYERYRIWKKYRMYEADRLPFSPDTYIPYKDSVLLFLHLINQKEVYINGCARAHIIDIIKKIEHSEKKYE